VVVVGCKYKHFKGNVYKVLALANHTETNELLVVYQDLNNEGKVWARPIEMFLSKVNKEKYPNCLQEYRFERIK
jgi:hypothetical protein